MYFFSYFIKVLFLIQIFFVWVSILRWFLWVILVSSERREQWCRNLVKGMGFYGWYDLERFQWENVDLSLGLRMDGFEVIWFLKREDRS